MKNHVAISLLLMLSFVCFAKNENEGLLLESLSKVPRSMMIAQLSSLCLNNSLELSNLDPDIQTREIDYTWGWLQKAITSDVLTGADKGTFRFLSGLGTPKDDALMISWEKDQFKISVVDGRFLLIIVRLTNESQNDVGAIFRKIVNYTYCTNKERVKVHVEKLSANDSNETWGRIIVERGNSRGWFEHPIEWLKIDNKIFFMFEKIVKPPESKIEPRNVSELIGGIPIDDVRSYLRFEKTNREQLAREYFKKRMPEKTDPKSVDNVDKGRPLYPDGLEPSHETETIFDLQ